MSSTASSIEEGEYHDHCDEEMLNHRLLDEKPRQAPPSPSRPGFRLLSSTPLVLLALGLLVCNVFLYAQNRRLKLAANDDGFTGLYARGKTWKQFRTYTEYSNVNRSVSDVLWESFTTNGFIAIPHDEAAYFGLPVAEDFPDDPNKGIYVLGGFHDLHCVMYLRNTINELMDGKSVDHKLVHIHHCYDALRQSIQCKADDTPLYAPYRSRLTGDGQFRRCRDWGALTKWAQEHTACWPTGHCADLE